MLSFFWLPEARLKDKRDRVPYELWLKQGYLEATPGDVIDYDHIRARINALGQTYRMLEIRVDPYNSTQLATQLAEQDGFTVTLHRQGFLSMNAPSKELERIIKSKRLEHAGHPVLSWMVGNVVVSTDASGNIKPDKAKATERIDGVVATIMGLAGVMAGNNGSSVYQSRGLIVL